MAWFRSKVVVKVGRKEKEGGDSSDACERLGAAAKLVNGLKDCHTAAVVVVVVAAATAADVECGC